MISRPLSDILPVQALSRFNRQPFAHFLAGGAKANHSWGSNWQILTALPVETLEVKGGRVWRNNVALGSAADICPFGLLSTMLQMRQQSFPDPDTHGLPPFLSGAVGHISYEMAQYLEPRLDLPEAGAATMAFGFYDAVAAWDRDQKHGFIFARTEKSADTLEYELRLELGGDHAPKRGSIATDVSSDKSRGQFVADVRHCIEQIIEGEIFQANVSRRLEAQVAELPDLSMLFHRWLLNSASGFAAVLQYKDKSYLSNSPERYFALRKEGVNRKIVAEPIKGTRRRDFDPETDRRLARDLLLDEKDRAENIMIADLVRNDLSRVCLDGSIREEKICELQSYAYVHHLVSRISGILTPGRTAVDVLKNSFPCGSITGAPKIRAMEVIGELENRQRGIYCGAIGYIDDSGSADFSVSIRTAEISHSKSGPATISYGAGGGITSLSDPLKEFEETSIKAETFFKLIDIIDGMLGNSQ